MSNSPISQTIFISEQSISDFLVAKEFGARVVDLRSSAALSELAAIAQKVPFAFQQMSPDWVQYDEEYAALHAEQQARYIIVFETNDEIDAIWILTLAKFSDGIQLGTRSLPIQPPMIATSSSNKRSKRIIKSCIELGCYVATHHGLQFWDSSEYGPTQSGLSNWYSISRQHGATCHLENHLFVDLSLTDVEYRAKIRSSNKSTLSAGFKRWKPEIYTGEDQSEWEDFRELHRIVSGRVTRSKATWDIQFQMIKSGSGFAVFTRDANGSLIGGIFIAHTHDEGIYVTGVFDRVLNDPSLGHISQSCGIQELKRRGVRWYKLGDRPFPSMESSINEKELAIAHFKDGFATHSFPHLYFRHPSTAL